MPSYALNVPRLQQEAAGEVKVASYTRLKAKRKLEILSQAGYKCQQCPNTKNLTIDHMIPVAELRTKYKTTAWSRLATNHCQILCIDCHNKKNLRSQV